MKVTPDYIVSLGLAWATWVHVSKEKLKYLQLTVILVKEEGRTSTWGLLTLCFSLSVFLSQFKLLWSQDSRTDSGAEDSGPRDVSTQETPPAGSGSGHSHEDLSLQAEDDNTIQQGLSIPLDEDGDLDVVRRPRAASDPNPADPARDKVHPMILAQEEDDLMGDQALESCPHSIIKIGK